MAHFLDSEVSALDGPIIVITLIGHGRKCSQFSAAQDIRL